MGLLDYRTVDYLTFELGPLTVLFGKNNSGKTNILEAMYGIFAPGDMPGYLAGAAGGARGIRRSSNPDSFPASGAVIVGLEPGLPFDDDVLAVRQSWVEPGDGDGFLPPLEVAFVGNGKPELTFVDPRECLARLHANSTASNYDPQVDLELEAICREGPHPLPLFLDWEFGDIDDRVGTAIFERLRRLPGGSDAVLEPVNDDAAEATWRVRPEIEGLLELFSKLATLYLPGFVNGSISARLNVPTDWGSKATISVTYHDHEHGDEDAQRLDALTELGRGTARWVANAIQIASHLLAHDQNIAKAIGAGRLFSGHVLFLDEPEAHLHASAVNSVVRWCEKMVAYGFNVIVASHHEEFLRANSKDIALVHVTRDAESSKTRARAIPGWEIPVRQKLASEVGMHPAIAMSLHRAILFVEGPFDEAVLDEYAGSRFAANGIAIIPIHGTKNLEGLVDGEFAPHLGIKTGVLTDNTITATISNRSNRKRSSEEVKIVRLIKRFEDQGLTPPTAFGVTEDDLLFALPEEAIREYLQGPFPGWRELREECRAAEGLGPSDSADWKSYAQKKYGLPITTADGVKSVIRALDLAGVELPSIRAVVDEIIAWAAVS